MKGLAKTSLWASLGLASVAANLYMGMDTRHLPFMLFQRILRCCGYEHGIAVLGRGRCRVHHT
jgi:hypothetical protein